VNCKSSVNKEYSFCPHCGYSMVDIEEEIKEFGMLGRMDEVAQPKAQPNSVNLGITDKLINSLMQNLMKSLDAQMKNPEKNGVPEIQSFPNGIRIKIGMEEPTKKATKKEKKQTITITEEQIKRMASMPRTTGKTNMRRLPDKVVYEISAPGIQSLQDIFVSKLESGYEVKAIGKNKVYVNSLPINLPMKSYAITEKGINIEFSLT